MPAKANALRPFHRIPVSKGLTSATTCVTPKGKASFAKKFFWFSFEPIERHISALFKPVKVGSRKGPAGIQNPFPNPKEASTVIIEKSLCTAGS